MQGMSDEIFDVVRKYISPVGEYKKVEIEFLLDIIEVISNNSERDFVTPFVYDNVLYVDDWILESIDRTDLIDEKSEE